MANFKEKQEERLKKINAELSRYNLRPFVHLGNYKNKEFELLEISGVWPNRWYVMVQFECLRPDGQPGHYSMKFSVDGRDRTGCMVVSVIHDEATGQDWLICVRQHRPTMLSRGAQHWTVEIPRIWATYQEPPPILIPPFEPDVKDHSRPERVIEHELSPVLKEPLIHLEKPLLLSGMDPEDTGMSADFLDTWLLRGSARDFSEVRKRLENNGALSIRFYEMSEVLKRRKELGLNDRHSKAALLDFYEHLNCITL